MKTAEIKRVYNQYKHDYLLSGNKQTTPLMDFNNFLYAVAVIEANYKQSIIGLIDELRANITILCISGGGKKN